MATSWTGPLRDHRRQPKCHSFDRLDDQIRLTIFWTSEVVAGWSTDQSYSSTSPSATPVYLRLTIRLSPHQACLLVRR